MKRTQRCHGVNDWTKGECQYSSTGWAWHYQATAAELPTYLREFGGWYTTPLTMRLPARIPGNRWRIE